jgi:O-antigen/teichoic acid export membrane protein
VGGTLEIVAPWLGVLLLSAWATSAEAAQFTAVARVVTAGTMVLVATRLALGPHLSGAFAAADDDRLARLHEHSTIWAVLLSFPFFLTLAVYPATVLSIFGPAFPAAAGALVVLAVANLVNVGVGNAQSIVLMGGRSGWNLAGTATALVVQLALGALLIPGGGVRGAAVALGASIVCSNLLNAWLVHRRLAIPVLPTGVVVSVAASSAVFLPLQLLARAALGDSGQALVLSTAVAALCLAAVVWLCRRRLDLAAGWRVLTIGFGSAGPA